MAEDLSLWAEEMRQGRKELADYGFVSLDDLKNPIPYAQSISAWLDAIRLKSIAEILQKAGVSLQKGLLFTGPQGTGKHRTATAILSSLIKQSDYSRWVWLTAADFQDLEADEVEDRLIALFKPYIEDEYIPQEIFLIECPERFSQGNVFFNTLSAILNACDENDCQAPLLLVTTTEDCTKYPELCVHFMQYRFRLPNSAQRESYFAQSFVYAQGKILASEKNKICLSDMSLSDLAEQTEKLTYTELSEFVEHCKLCAIAKTIASGFWDPADFALSKYPLSRQDILDLLPEQVKPQTIQQTVQVTQLQAVATNTEPQQTDSVFSHQNITKLEKMVSSNTYDPSKRKLLEHHF